MSKWTYHPRDFAYFDEFLSKGREKYYPGRRLCKNTRVFRDSIDKIVVEYHSTHIVTLHRNGDIDLDMGGWDTTSTKRRVNTYSTLAVWFEKGQWYVARKPIWFDGRLNPATYIYDCYYAHFPADRRKSPTDVEGVPLVRRSTHERELRTQAEQYRKLKRYAAWIRRHGSLEWLFRDWVSDVRDKALEEMRMAAFDEKAEEIDDLRRELAALEQQLAELKLWAEPRTIEEPEIMDRERVIEL